MASAKEVIQWVPDTLPEDFSEWDGEQSSAAGKPAGLVGSHAPADTPKSLGPAEREAILASVLDRARDPLSAASTPRIVKQPKLAPATGDRTSSRVPQKAAASESATAATVKSAWSDVAAVEEPKSTSELRAAAFREADAVLFQSFSSDVEIVEEPETSKKKWIITASVSAAAIIILLLVMIPLFRHKAKQPSAQPVQTSQAMTYTQQSDLQKPSASAPLTTETPQAQVAQKDAQGQLADAEQEAKSPHVRADMMNDQLAAPSLISQDAKRQSAEDAPPPGTIMMGGNGADESLFKGQAQPVVKSAKPMAISAGVATGLLIQKTVPVYPAIAKSARVTGTVVLKAIITKEGAIRDVHVDSGPQMLRQSALDAVRNWRYRPYKLNNETTEVETTINVIFSLN